MADVGRAGHPRRKPSDRDHAPAAGELLEKRQGRRDLGGRRPPVRARSSRMSRDDVPAKSLQPELGQRPPDDRRRRLGRAAAGELALGGERDPGDSRPAVAGRFPDEEQGCSGLALEVVTQPHPAEIRTRPVPVEVERVADPRGGEPRDESFRLHAATMLLTMRGRIAALGAAVVVPTALAASPQGFQSNASFAASYAARGVTTVVATAQRVSCYAPEVLYMSGLGANEGYPDGGSTACPGATTGELLGPFSNQDRSNPALVVKDHSESDIHVDPTNATHLIGISKWVVNSEGYNHLTGFFESFDTGATWPTQGHIPGYEGWTDNSDPVGAFDPWGNFYAIVLPYMFDYTSSGTHRFLSSAVNPRLARSGIGVTVRTHGAATANAWLTTGRSCSR